MDLARRLDLRTRMFESDGAVLPVLMLELALFVIVLLMLKEKKGDCKKFCVN